MRPDDSDLYLWGREESARRKTPLIPILALIRRGYTRQRKEPRSGVSPTSNIDALISAAPVAPKWTRPSASDSQGSGTMQSGGNEIEARNMLAGRPKDRPSVTQSYAQPQRGLW